MLISIIIPFYNAELFLERAVNSALNQDYGSIEILLIDNNSTDRSNEIAGNFCRLYPDRIRLFFERKVGANYARNKGLRQASGDWVQFLDADDVILESKLSCQLGLISDCPNSDLIIGSYTIENLDGSKETYVSDNSQGNLLSLITLNLGTTSANLYKRKSLDEVGGWDASLDCYHDIELTFRFIKENKEIRIDKDIHTNRFVTSNSITTSPVQGLKNQTRARVFKEMLDYAIESELYDTRTEGLFKDCLFYRLVPMFGVNKVLAINWYNEYIGRGHTLKWNHLPYWYKTYFNILGFETGCLLYHSLLKNMRDKMRN